MEVKAKVAMEVSMSDIAESLARSPEDFAQFWFAFAEVVKKKDIDLEPFGQAMAPTHGGMRKEPFSAIHDAMRHHERVADRSAGNGY